MDTLSLFILIIEIMLGGAVCVSAVIAFKQLILAMSKLTLEIKKASKLVQILVDFIELFSLVFVGSFEYIIKRAHEDLVFSVRYISISIQIEYNIVKKLIASRIENSKSFTNLSFDRGKPKIRISTNDILPSSSYLRISPVILQ